MLGSQLFERRPHGLVLTETGAIYLVDVIDALERLSGSTVRIMGNRKGGGIVQVVSTPTFATLWLLPRLPEFYRRHPRIQIMLRTRSTPFNLLEANVDLAINMSFVNWPGTIADPLVTTSVVVVCSPEFKQRHGLKCPEDLIGLPLIQHYTMPNTWTDWLNEMGVAHPEPSVGQQFDQFTLATQAAVAGLGIASLSLGASHMRTALRVILPLIAPGMHIPIARRTKLKPRAMPRARSTLIPTAVLRPRLARAPRPSACAKISRNSRTTRPTWRPSKNVR